MRVYSLERRRDAVGKMKHACGSRSRSVGVGSPGVAGEGGQARSSGPKARALEPRPCRMISDCLCGRRWGGMTRGSG
jgi:hypothetical protein